MVEKVYVSPKEVRAHGNIVTDGLVLTDLHCKQSEVELVDGKYVMRVNGSIITVSLDEWSVYDYNSVACSVVLTDLHEVPLAGEDIRFTVDSETPVTVTTNSNGVAVYNIDKVRGSHTVLIEYLTSDSRLGTFDSENYSVGANVSITSFGVGE